MPANTLEHASIAASRIAKPILPDADTLRLDEIAIDEPARLPRAPLIEPLISPVSGYLARLDAREVGYTVVELGGGRAKKGDPVDPAVGVVLSEHSKVGSHIEAGEPLLWVHARTAEALAAALGRLAHAYNFADAPVATPPVIHRIIRTAPAAELLARTQAHLTPGRDRL